MPQIKVVIQSRLSSSRLPAKALLPVAGYPAAVLCALRAANTGLDVVVATSVDPTDDPLVQEFKKAGIAFSRGPLDNVLARFNIATGDLSPDCIIVRMTADNLLPDGELIQELVAALVKQKLKYLVTNFPQLPYGLAAEAFTAEVLREAAENTSASYDLEHVTPWIRRKYYQEEFFPQDLGGNFGHLRCTLDTFEDYIRVLKIFETAEDPLRVSWRELVRNLAKIPGEPECRVPFRIKNNTVQSALTFGTVQLGIPYGAANKGGMPPKQEAISMIRRAITYGVTTLDTARAYGESESRVGEALTGGFAERVKVITKLDSLTQLQPDENERNVTSAVEASIFRSCCELRTRSLPVVMLHRWHHYHEYNGAVWKRLLELKQQGYIQSLGASVQTPEEGLKALDEPHIKYIQLPFNLLDWRWKQAGFDQKVSQREDITIHVRSAYLQGILIATPDVWPRVDGVFPEEWLEKIDLLVKKTGRESRADLCLAYVRAQTWVDSIVIGMETEEQLVQNIKLFQKPPLSQAEVFMIENMLGNAPENLLNPAKWVSR